MQQEMDDCLRSLRSGSTLVAAAIISVACLGLVIEPDLVGVGRFLLTAGIVAVGWGCWRVFSGDLNLARDTIGYSVAMSVGITVLLLASLVWALMEREIVDVKPAFVVWRFIITVGIPTLVTILSLLMGLGVANALKWIFRRNKMW